MKNKFRYIFTLVIFIFIYSNSIVESTISQTDITNSIDTDTTWTRSNSPYLITQSITVSNGATLTIEPGTEIKFNGDFTLQIQGKLIADNVKFTSIPTRKGTIKLSSSENIIKNCDINNLYYGIYIDENSNNNEIINSKIHSNKTGVHLINNNKNKIINSQIINNINHGIYTDKVSDLLIENTTIKNSSSAIYILSEDTNRIYENFIIKNCNITNNSYGIYISNKSYPLIEYNNIYDNTQNIYIKNGEDSLFDFKNNYWNQDNDNSIKANIIISYANENTEINSIPFLTNLFSYPKITNIKLEKATSAKFKLKVTIETDTTDELSYQIWSEDKNGWSLVKSYDISLENDNTYTWIANRTNSDQYRVQIRIKGIHTNIVYDQMSETATCKDLGIVKIDEIITDSNIEGYGKVNESINITAISSGGDDIEYEFLQSQGESWKILKEFNSSDSYTWTPNKPGNYEILVKVRNENDETHELKLNYEITDLLYTNQSYIYPEIDDMNLSEIDTNGNISITPQNTKGSNLEYRYTIGESLRYTDVVKNYSSQRNYTWKPEKSGVYMITTYIKDEDSKKYQDGVRKYKRIAKPEVGEVKITDVKLSHSEFIQPKGTTMTFEANSSGGNLPQYAFFRLEAKGYRLIQDYSENNTFIWTPVNPGRYTILVRVKDALSGSYEDQKSFTYDITDLTTSNIKINDINIEGILKKRENQVITADAEGTDSLMYKFFVIDKWLGWRTIGNFSPNNTCNWIPRKSGNYTVGVWVMDATSGSYEEELTKEITIN